MSVSVLPRITRRSRSRSRKILAIPAVAAAALVFATPAAEAGAPHGKPAGPPHEFWRVVWEDHFNGPAGAPPSPAKWIIDTGHSYPGGPNNWGTGEIQEYTANPENVALDGAGYLRITPRRDDSGHWTSARIETKRKNFRPPKNGVLAIEARIQLPTVTGTQALGYWAAFWALGAPYRGDYWNWPRIGEFDIMENVNGLNQVWGVLHCGIQQGGPCDETNGIGATSPCLSTACTGNFHTYRFEWDDARDELRWYVDGVHYHTVTRGQIGDQAWTEITGHEGYFILLNLAMGGGFPNGVAGHPTPVPETQPGHPMVVDYVQVSTLPSGKGKFGGKGHH
ncbi:MULTISPECIES: glycoside hydrolase family 16 protein [Thermocrispum]|uniref:Glycoside hydrolase family 16 protein n=1 Tax=Thermocrispum agreste TaxID=37925 RepID=A0A2W4K3C6_9PSEU|nr:MULTISPECIES: glycoside hydrolase family 16 protein [Thermocrispum]PZN00718.1 MAG: hypothetical protein DIU77_02880 [Thermocrispum agreste]